MQIIHVGGNPSQSKRAGRRETGKEGKLIKCVIELVTTVVPNSTGSPRRKHVKYTSESSF